MVRQQWSIGSVRLILTMGYLYNPSQGPYRSENANTFLTLSCSIHLEHLLSYKQKNTQCCWRPVSNYSLLMPSSYFPSMSLELQIQLTTSSTSWAWSRTMKKMLSFWFLSSIVVPRRKKKNILPCFFKSSKKEAKKIRSYSFPILRIYRRQLKY